MAEFCRECSKRYGMYFDGIPDFCEGCGQFYRGYWYYHFWDDLKAWIKKLFKKKP